jgi:hypothetical protein
METILVALKKARVNDNLLISDADEENKLQREKKRPKLSTDRSKEVLAIM